MICRKTALQMRSSPYGSMYTSPLDGRLERRKLMIGLNEDWVGDGDILASKNDLSTAILLAYCQAVHLS